MQVNYFFIATVSFLAGAVFIFLFRKFSLRFNILTTRGIPLIGGIAIALSFVFACLAEFFIFRNLSQEITGIVVPALIMFFLGIMDDWHELSVMAKLFTQVISTSLLIFFGIRAQIAHIGSLANIAITFIWVLGISNAFNHLDVLDGVAAGSAIIVALSFFVISFLNADTQIAILALALSGAVFSFLIYNLPPAKIYMGNSGSHFLGFILAAIALAISYAPPERKAALFSPLFVLGLPIFDTAFLIFMRIRQNRPVFQKSNDHLALRFLRLGYSKNKTLSFMLILAMFFSLCGIAISRAHNFFGLTIVISAVLVSLALAKGMGRASINA